jgi:hypothetical protein
LVGVQAIRTERSMLAPGLPPPSSIGRYVRARLFTIRGEGRLRLEINRETDCVISGFLPRPSLTSLHSDAVRHHRRKCPSWPECAGWFRRGRVTGIAPSAIGIYGSPFTHRRVRKNGPDHYLSWTELSNWDLSLPNGNIKGTRVQSIVKQSYLNRLRVFHRLLRYHATTVVVPLRVD